MIEKIMTSYIKTKQDQEKTDAVYKPSNIWMDGTIRKDKRYEPFIKKKDIDGFENLLANFLRDKEIYGNTFNIPTTFMFSEYEIWKRLEGANLKEAEDSGIGNPPHCMVGEYMLDTETGGITFKHGIKLTTSSLRYQYNAYKISKLLKNINEPIIVELGGGYGGLTYYLMKKNKRKMTYIIYDLPEVAVLSSYYLSTAFPDKKILLYDDYEHEKHHLDFYDIIILPNFKLSELPSKYVDLVLNFRSLSEMNKQSIEEYISQITRVSKYCGYFMHENCAQARDVKISQSKFYEVPASDFLLPKEFMLLYENKSPFYDGRYYEYLYEHLDMSHWRFANIQLTDPKTL